MKRFVLSLCLFSTLVAARAMGDTHKFAVVVGNNMGHDPTRPLRYAEQDARKFHAVLTDIGEVPAENASLLLGKDASEVWAAVRRIEKRAAALKRNKPSKSILIIFYSGHAEGDVLELNSSSLRMDQLLGFLRSSSLDVRLAFLDSCRSGKLVTMKGGKRGPAFNIALSEEIASKGYAIVTSSSDSELSQESSEIRGAYFTHYLISALRGAGDISGDGKVTLQEAYGYAYARTLARTSVTVGGTQHPMYEFQLEGRGDVVLTRTSGVGARLAVTLPESGRLVILDSSRHAIVAETEIESGKTAHIALGAGSFITYLMTSEGMVRAARIDVLQGESALLDQSDFQSVSLEDTVEKGGLFSDRELFEHSVSMGGLWRLFALKGATSSYGAALAYRARHRDGWQPSARLVWSTRGDVGVSTGYYDLGLLAGMGYSLPLRRVELRGEILAGYEHIFQSPYEGEKRHTSGFDYLALIGASLPMHPFVLTLEGGIGGRTFQVIGSGWVHRMDAQVSLGVGWRWGKR